MAVVYQRHPGAYVRSHYREWIQRWQNPLCLTEYISRRDPEWDYLALAQRMNLLFHNQVSYANYDAQRDTVRHFSELADLPELPRTAPRNPSLTALEVEALRLVNAREIPPPPADPSASDPQGALQDVLETVELPHPPDAYGELVRHPLLDADRTYAKALATETGFAMDVIEGLLTPLPEPVADIAQVSGHLTAHLQDRLETRRATA